jgi:type I restriction enzyme S subunit
MSKWQTVELGDFLKLYRIEHRVQDQTIYKQVTISKTKGILFRGEKQGKNIGRKRQFLIDLDTYPNTLLFTRQGVFDGSIGIAPIEVNQCIVTENMPMMSVDTSIVEIEYLKKILISEYLFEKIRKLKIVGSAQKSIHERDLLKIEIKLPAKSEQVEICKKFNTLDIEHNELTGEISSQQAILKKLRQQILQDAIEGKLTKDWREKNSDVEPASELLKRIQSEKQQLIEDKKFKKGKKQIASEGYKHDVILPEVWTLPDLDDVTMYITDGTHQTPKYTLTGKMFLSAQNVKPFKFMPENHKYVSDDDFKGYTKNRKTEKGDLLVGRVGSKGETAVVDQDLEFAIYVSLGLVKTFKDLTSPEYLAIVMNSPYGNNYATGNMSSLGASAGNFNLGRIRSFPVPFPPLQEQKEIVKKVEKLFAICDQLEEQITSSQTNAEQLMQSVLKEAFSQNSAA